MGEKRAIEEEDQEDAVQEPTSLSKKEKKRLKKLRQRNAVLDETEHSVLEEPVREIDQVDEPSQDEEAVERKRRKKEEKLLRKLAKTTTSANMSAEPTTTEPTTILTNKKSKIENKTVAIGNYIEHRKTREITSEALNAFRTESNISIFPTEEAASLRPILDFEYLDASFGDDCSYVKKYILDKKFSNPSPIQAQCWPPLLMGRDVIGIAQTGSGKTLSFLVPALLKIARLGAGVSGVSLNANTKHQKLGVTYSSAPRPRVLILAPTRELALQSHEVVVALGGIKGVCIFGGVPKPQQKNDLRNGAEVVVATPGRLLDLLEENALTLSDICYMVLDEADRMLDDGFEPAIRKILGACPRAGSGPNERQTVMFSATWPEEIRSLAETFLRPDVIRVTVGSEDLSANHRVTQIVECCEGFEKNKKLFGLLEKYHKSRKNRCLIFVLYKKEAVTLQSVIEGRGFLVTSIHGDKSQYDRMAALEAFKNGSIPLLIATDVAARGLDIPQVEYVINYTFPLTVEDYVHRIGRTGRGGATGISHTFFTDAEKPLAGALVAVLQEAGQQVPQEIYKYPMMTKKKQSKLYGDFGPKADLAGKKATKIVFD